jgi:hypothetical protein
MLKHRANARFNRGYRQTWSRIQIDFAGSVNNFSYRNAEEGENVQQGPENAAEEVQEAAEAVQLAVIPEAAPYEDLPEPPPKFRRHASPTKFIVNHRI